MGGVSYVRVHDSDGLLHNSDLSGGHNLQIIMHKPRRSLQLWGCRAYEYACTTAVLGF